MKPIIFLEIDGVLTTQNGTDEALRARGDIFDQNGIEFFSNKACEALNKITNSTNADIVITSDWRFSMTLSEIQELFKARDITGNVIDMITKSERIPSIGIEKWIKDNGLPKSFIIIDDELEIESLVETFSDKHCIGVNFTEGLANRSHYKRAINYLNKAQKQKNTKVTNNKNLF